MQEFISPLIGGRPGREMSRSSLKGHRGYLLTRIPFPSQKCKQSDISAQAERRWSVVKPRFVLLYYILLYFLFVIISNTSSLQEVGKAMKDVKKPDNIDLSIPPFSHSQITAGFLPGFVLRALYIM